MKRNSLVVLTAAAGFLATSAPLQAMPIWQSLPHQKASEQTPQPPAVSVRGYRHPGWRPSFGSLFMLPPALAALVLHPFMPVPRQGYREVVRPDPVAQDVPARAAPSGAPDGRSPPWVDPDEPAR